MEDQRFFNKGVWKGLIIAIIAVAAVQLVLAWQYYRLEEKRLPQIEKQLAEHQEELEKQAVKETATSFLEALKKGDSELALRFLTENAVLQEQQGMFSLTERIEGYEIVKLEQIGDKEFRAQVEIAQQALPPEIWLLRVLKILDAYYIDSVERAG